MKHTKEIIIIIICSILLNSDYLNAQTGTTGTTTEVNPLQPRYTGLCIDYRANDSFIRVMKMFNDAGYSLELDGTTQSVRIDVVNFYDSYLPNSAAAVAMGLDNDSAVWIQINSQTWYYMDEDRRDYTLLHEIAHDYFNLRHTENPRDLMFPALPNQIGKRDVLRVFNQLIELCQSR
jgi:hypothetical protein